MPKHQATIQSFFGAQPPQKKKSKKVVDTKTKSKKDDDDQIDNNDNTSITNENIPNSNNHNKEPKLKTKNERRKGEEENNEAQPAADEERTGKKRAVFDDDDIDPVRKIKPQHGRRQRRRVIEDDDDDDEDEEKVQGDEKQPPNGIPSAEQDESPKHEQSPARRKVSPSSSQEVTTTRDKKPAGRKTRVNRNDPDKEHEIPNKDDSTTNAGDNIVQEQEPSVSRLQASDEGSEPMKIKKGEDEDMETKTKSAATTRTSDNKKDKATPSFFQPKSSSSKKKGKLATTKSSKKKEITASSSPPTPSRSSCQSSSTNDCKHDTSTTAKEDKDDKRSWSPSALFKAAPKGQFLSDKQILDSIETEQWPESSSIPYVTLCQVFGNIEEITGRLQIQELLTKLLRQILLRRRQRQEEQQQHGGESPETDSNDLQAVLYLASNEVAPAYQCVELGIGDAILIKAIGEATGTATNMVKAKYESVGDLGTVAMTFKSKQKTLGGFFGASSSKTKGKSSSSLTARTVLQVFREIAETKGNQAQKWKVDKIKKLLVKSTVGIETKYIIRGLQGKLRIGLAQSTVLIALAHALALTQVVPSFMATTTPRIADQEDEELEYEDDNDDD